MSHMRAGVYQDFKVVNYGLLIGKLSIILGKI